MIPKRSYVTGFLVIFSFIFLAPSLTWSEVSRTSTITRQPSLSKESTRRSIQKTTVVDFVKPKMVDCPAEACRMEACHEFWTYLNFIWSFPKILHPEWVWEGTMPVSIGGAPGGSAFMSCYVYPKELIDIMISLAANCGNVPFKNECRLPDEVYNKQFFIYDSCIAWNGLNLEQCSYPPDFPPQQESATHRILCIEKDFEIGSLVTACGENCCK